MYYKSDYGTVRYNRNLANPNLTNPNLANPNLINQNETLLLY